MTYTAQMGLHCHSCDKRHPGCLGTPFHPAVHGGGAALAELWRSTATRLCQQQILKDLRITNAGPPWSRNWPRDRPRTGFSQSPMAMSHVQHRLGGRGSRKESDLPTEAAQSALGFCIFSQPVHLPNIPFPQCAPTPNFICSRWPSNKSRTEATKALKKKKKQ